jgi:predicted metalloprotease with PDZ domain
MMRPTWRRFAALTILLAPMFAQAKVSYTLRVSDPAAHTTAVEARVPTQGNHQVELFMPVWSPGYYQVENYHHQLRDFTAKSPDGKSLTVEQPQPNRFRIACDGDSVVIHYALLCTGRSVTTNYVGKDGAIWNGPATFLALASHQQLSYEVRLILPADWPDSATALPKAEGGAQHHFIAADYDQLADSPILAGALRTRSFAVGATALRFVDQGQAGSFDSAQAVELLTKVIAEHDRFLGGLPFDHYTFLNVFRQGGGGLEHSFSTLLTTAPNIWRTPNVHWLSFVSHEFFHAINVKRLRPIELGPFDYEHPPRTASLWIAEGLTTYFGDLALARSGVANREEWLQLMSVQIRRLQEMPGRKVQTLEQASLEVWEKSMSGVGGDPEKTVDYYVKGPCAGFVIDAAIRRATDGKNSLDDVMRLAHRRWSGAKGYTHAEFLGAISEVAGTDLGTLLHAAIQTTDELDYQPALDWFGLRFANQNGKTTWQLEVAPNATPAQQQHFAAYLAASVAR